MKKLKSIIKRLFRVEYRLTIVISGKVINTYGINRRLLANMGKNTLGAEYWSLYKSGPLGLSEREIGFGHGREEE